MTIEKLTDTEVQIVATTSSGAKSLRLSNALTEALTASERSTSVWMRAAEKADSACVAAEARVRELEAENERLRKKADSEELRSDSLDGAYFAVYGRAEAAESSLAAATALLVRWANTVDANVFPVPHLYLKADTEVFLASAQPAAHDPADRVLQWAGPAARADIGQPAAPTRTVERLPPRHIPEDQLVPVEAPVRPPRPEHVARILADPDCEAPTRTEACDECGITHGPGNTNRLCPKASDYSPALVAKIEREWPTRTEAEQAVLDAMAGMPEEQLRWTIEMQDDDDAPVVAACRAELARRGLK